MKSLFIGTVEVPCVDGLYFITALHKASGSLAKDAPNRFIRLKETQDYIGYHVCTDMGNSKNQQVTKTIIGNGTDDNAGTYVSKKIAYRYAMWISHEFYDLVVDAFDLLANNNPDEATRIVNIYQGHQPSHPNSLSALLGIPKNQSKPYFDHLRQKDIIGVTYEPRLPQAIYHAGVEAGELIIGKHGHTLLFDNAIKDVFPRQTAWFE